MLHENADCSNGTCTGEEVVLVGSVVSLSDGRLAVSECSNLKRIEHYTSGHGGSASRVGSGDGARSSELLDRWYDASVGCRRRKVRVSLQRYSGTRKRMLHTRL
jgi:hypothetical protein